MTSSDRVYLGLVSCWLLLDILLLFAPPDVIPPGQHVGPDRLLVDVGLAVAGFFALRAAHRSGFETLWSRRLSIQKRFALPVAAGLILGAVPAGIDAVAPIGNIHAAFPASIPNYAVGAIFTEVLFRLVPLGLLVWGLATKLLGTHWQGTVFWTLALGLALIEPVAAWQIVSDPTLPGGFDSTLAAAGFVTVAYVLNVLAAYLFWTRGFLAAVVLRLAFYLVWHVLWPLVWYSS